MTNLRVGVVNRYAADERHTYPLGLALHALGATFVPIDVRSLAASIGHDQLIRLGLADDLDQIADFDELRLDGVVWRVSEAAFRTYSDLQWQISRRYLLSNSWECGCVCADKWRTSVKLSEAGIGVVPTILLLPGAKVPAFSHADTIIKPSVGARGQGVRPAQAGTDPGIDEPYVAQPLIGGAASAQIRALVCGFTEVAAMYRLPTNPSGHGRLQVNNLESGGTPMAASAAPVRDIAMAAARCLGGDVLGVDLIRYEGEWVVLEVNGSPGLDGIASVTDVNIHRLAAEAILRRLSDRGRLDDRRRR